jgi:hypothetical protein
MADFKRISVFGPVRAHVEGLLSKGRLVSVFASGSIDLTNAHLPAEGAELRIVTVFGSVDVILPASMPVMVSGAGVFGQFGRMKRAAAVLDPAAPGLRIDGASVFGNVTLV